MASDTTTNALPRNSSVKWSLSLVAILVAVAAAVGGTNVLVRVNSSSIETNRQGIVSTNKAIEKVKEKVHTQEVTLTKQMAVLEACMEQLRRNERVTERCLRKLDELDRRPRTNP